MSAWVALEHKVLNLKNKTTIGLVGKYVELPDAYLSVVEALKHAGYTYDSDIDIHWINAEEVNDDNVADFLGDVDGVLVPGGFGQRGIEGKISAIKYARENKVPFFGICLGMQLACVEFARNVAHIEDAQSGEVAPEAANKIIDILPNQLENQDLGGTLRLGLQPCVLQKNTKAYSLYMMQDVIEERHRHRYEFNNEYRDILVDNGLVLSGLSPDNKLVEIVEVADHPFFIGCQFHPEFISRPNRPHPLFGGFVEASVLYQKNGIHNVQA